MVKLISDIIVSEKSDLSDVSSLPKEYISYSSLSLPESVAGRGGGISIFPH